MICPCFHAQRYEKTPTCSSFPPRILQILRFYSCFAASESCSAASESYFAASESYFQAVKIYFHALKIYSHALKIYFHDMKKVFGGRFMQIINKKGRNLMGMHFFSLPLQHQSRRYHEKRHAYGTARRCPGLRRMQ